MELESRINKQDWIDFGDPPNEKAVQFMMEHYGFPNIDHLSDEGYDKLFFELSRIEVCEHYDSQSGIDESNPDNYDEWGELKRRPLSEYALMVGGMLVYMANHNNGARRPV